MGVSSDYVPYGFGMTSGRKVAAALGLGTGDTDQAHLSPHQEAPSASAPEGVHHHLLPRTEMLVMRREHKSIAKHCQEEKISKQTA